MKRIFFGLLLLFCFISVRAQTDSLQEYTGKFKFPDGNPVTEINMVFENGLLTGTSVLGNSEFRKTETKDVFDIVAYAGVATFRRNAEGKITGMRVQVNDLDMEGTKTEGIQSAGKWESGFRNRASNCKLKILSKTFQLAEILTRLRCLSQPDNI